MMRGFWLSTLLIFVPSAVYAQKEQAQTPINEKQLLNQMHLAANSLTYELSYILVNRNTIQPLRYRHTLAAGKTFAQLFYLSGASREVLQQGATISYIGQNNDSFSLSSSAIVAPLMPFLHVDVTKISQYYDLINVGKAREAGQICDVIRIAAKDGLRYSYLLWVDNASKLPLRADLIDRNGDLLEQYYAIALQLDTPQDNRIAQELTTAIQHTSLPQELTLPNKPNLAHSHWTVNWVPEGFVGKKVNRYLMAVTNDMVESKLFTDGLFNFSVYVYPQKDTDTSEQIIHKGRQSLYALVIDNKQVVVMGDIPIETAKTIAQSVLFE